MSKRLFGLFSGFLVVLLILSACGGGSKNTTSTGGGTTPQTQNQRSHISSIPGMHIFSVNKTTAFNFQLIPTVYAQVVQTITLSQSWNGVCNSSPTVPQTSSLLVYGLGQNSSPDCTNQSFFDTTGVGAATSASTGELVVGNGTVTNLVAYTSQGSHIQTGVTIHLWVRRAGQIVDTGISCQIPVGTGFQKCNSTTTFAALDGDLAIATETLNPADSVSGLNVVFTKG